jgi:hypothetical protein
MTNLVDIGMMPPSYYIYAGIFIFTQIMQLVLLYQILEKK